MTEHLRFHSLDALRAVMMWLGIVLHSAMVYMEPGIDMHRSPETSLIATSLFGWIHIYRMPLFFMLAGFFTCLLVIRKGYIETLRHRAIRIGLPFIVFWPILLVLINMIIEAHAAHLSPSAPGVSFNVSEWIITSGHLWFLYYLILFTPFAVLGAFTLTRGMPPKWRDAALDAAASIMASWWGVALLAIGPALLSAGYPASVMSGDGAFVPDWTSLLYYLMFYLIGWVLFLRRSLLLAHYALHWKLYLALAIPSFIIANVLGFMSIGLLGDAYVRADIEFMFRLVYSVSVWLWGGFFLGVFLKMFSSESFVLRYISDSSYWVYLSHYPVVLALAYLLYGAPLSALTKMSILIISTTVICLISYQFCVRRTWIGQLLNGRRLGPDPSSMHRARSQAG